jgi:hypothetical protein
MARLVAMNVRAGLYNVWCLFNAPAPTRKAKHPSPQARFLVILASFKRKVGNSFTFHLPPERIYSDYSGRSWMPKKGEELLPQKEIQGFVSMFSMMWKEVDRQFPDLSREEKLKVFEITSSAFTDFMDIAFGSETWDEDEDDEDGRR